MEWYFFAIASAIVTAIIGVTEKKILQHEHSLTFSVTHALIALVISLPFFIYFDFSTITPQLIIAIYFAMLLAAAAFWLTAKGVKHLELSVSSPLTLLNFIFLPFLAFLFVGERLSFKQIAGVCLILLGVLALELIVHRGKFFPHIKTKGKEQYFLFMLIAGLFYAVTAILDKHLLAAVNPFTYLLLAHFFIALNSLLFFAFFDKEFKRDLKKIFSQDLKTTIFVAFLSIIQRLTFAFAASAAYISIAVAIKRLSILFSALLAGKLFHEKNIVEKLAVSILMLIGALLLVWP